VGVAVGVLSALVLPERDLVGEMLAEAPRLREAVGVHVMVGQEETELEDVVELVPVLLLDCVGV